MRIPRLLVPTDFSDFSDAALDYATGVAEPFDAEIHLLHIVEQSFVDVLRESSGDRMTEEFKVKALRKLKQTALRLKEQGREVRYEVRVGVPAVEILRYAAESNSSLIAMGTQGRTGIDHFLVGSVAEKVIRKSHCPVVTVPENYSPQL